MTVDPFKSFEAALPSIIAESPSQIMRQREVVTDTFKGPQVYQAGPYTVRIEPYGGRGDEDTWDEKGSSVSRRFALVGYNLPVTVLEAGNPVPVFKLNDAITDNWGNTFRVVSPQFVRGKVVQLALELRG